MLKNKLSLFFTVAILAQVILYIRLLSDVYTAMINVCIVQENAPEFNDTVQLQMLLEIEKLHNQIAQRKINNLQKVISEYVDNEQLKNELEIEKRHNQIAQQKIIKQQKEIVELREKRKQYVQYSIIKKHNLPKCDEDVIAMI